MLKYIIFKILNICLLKKKSKYFKVLMIYNTKKIFLLYQNTNITVNTIKDDKPSHIFLTLQDLNSACKTKQKEPGRGKKTFQSQISSNRLRSILSNSETKHSMTHYFQQKRVSPYTHENQSFETQSYSRNRDSRLSPFLNLRLCHVCFTLKETT
jgi:hypothetical protein